MALPINNLIKGQEKQKCSVLECDWYDRKRSKDNNGRSTDYGVYLPNGKYYCPKHGNELWEMRKNELSPEIA